MSADNTTQDRIATLREEVTTAERKLKSIERTPAKNSMLAAATAARLSELRTELAALEESEAQGRAGVGSAQRRDTSVLHNLRPEFSIHEHLRPDTSVTHWLRTSSPSQMLTEAHSLATDPHERTRGRAAAIRAALNATEETHAAFDGWLWAEEALTQIERGDNKPALWEKVADNLATLLARGR